MGFLRRDGCAVLTAPNALSLSRVGLAPLFVWALVQQRAALACAVFALVIATDLLDGRLARRSGRASPLGTLIDHTSDAAFVTIATAASAWLGLLPALLPLAIAVAFAQYVVDSRGPARVVLRHSSLGRVNGIAYFAVAGLAAFTHLFSTDPTLAAATRAAGWLLVVTTAISMVDRARDKWLRHDRA